MVTAIMAVTHFRVGLPLIEGYSRFIDNFGISPYDRILFKYAIQSSQIKHPIIIDFNLFTYLLSSVSLSYLLSISHQQELFHFYSQQELIHCINLLMDSFPVKFQQPPVSSSANLDSMVIREYQANLRIFLRKVEEQVAMLIRKYQSQLNELRKQNNLLKQKLSKREESNPEDQMFRTVLNFKNLSPVKKNSSGGKFLSDELKLFCSTSKKNQGQEYNTLKNYLDFGAEDLSSSRFEAKKTKNKIHQQNLITALEAGKSNFQANTSKLLDLLGRNQSLSKKQSSSSEEEQVKSTQEKQEIMNTSLSSVCQSLDNSFHGKKSKRKNELKRKEKEKLKAQRLQEARKNYKDRKQLGLKNLLKTLRSNVSSTESKPLSTLKNLRIAHSGYDSQSVSFPHQKQKKNSESKSKVLIDPNPIDISQSKFRSSINDTAKKPQSILKINSTILSKSILSGYS